MRIMVHDYGGYSFPIQLSRSLAERGHDVIHVFSQSVLSPQGSLKRRTDDPPTLSFKGISLSNIIEKQSYVKRRKQEIEYGHLLVKEVREWGPDVVLSGNTPLDTQKLLMKQCKVNDTKFIFWIQDLYGVAVDRILRKKIPLIGSMIGSYYVNLERNLLRKSEDIILITEDFKKQMNRWKIDKNLHVIENWAPLEDLPIRKKDNEWSRKHGLHQSKCIVYSGTLGMKHNPSLLLNLAVRFNEQNDVKVVVVSEGAGADWLKEQKEKRGLENLLIYGFQPFDQVANVLGSADLLVAVLEPDAGEFSVPSKVLTYHCAGKPMLLSVPETNLAAKIVRRENSGKVVAPHQSEEFLNHAEELISDEITLKKMGSNARAYAEEAFDIKRITDKFESVIG
ncbi:glycosyltransferase family 4 protein [Bacillus sp. N1-1]|uniref:glycosyltransferase family 4 protein n=1 Tax=Bacillus sp. N1-1 TaxID=2682541 RepID=UPI001318D918|nr:glycosyltransferase family 4 protein [Bacillus sp. N1-1]QHA93697.1 glycosyltransferase [Bacillus sp. N1-1]